MEVLPHWSVVRTVDRDTVVLRAPGGALWSEVALQDCRDFSPEMGDAAVATRWAQALLLEEASGSTGKAKARLGDPPPLEDLLHDRP